MQKIGINTNNECGSDFFEICDNIKKSGFEEVMIALSLGKEEKQFEYIKKLGLNIAFVHLDNTFTNNMWVKGFAHDEEMELFKRQIELCSKFGAKIAVMHATIGDPSSTVIGPSVFALNEFKTLVDFAESKNVKIALENVDNNSFLHFNYLLENIKSKNLGFCYDVGHHNLYNKNIDLIKLFGNRLLAVHLHDNLGDYVFGDDFTKDVHLLPFDGNVNFFEIMQQLKSVGYKNTIMLEVHKFLFDEVKIYKNLTNDEYLKKAKQIAEKLKEMV